MTTRLWLTAGKGGVGRSSVAAALARAAARGGSRVLAIDIVADGGLRRALGDGALGDGTDTVSVLELELETVVREYVQKFLKVPIPATRVGPIKGIFDYVATAAPGVREILTIGKVVEEVQGGEWDVVIADAPATGHLIELLSAPENLKETVGIGPLAGQADGVAATLHDPDVTGVIVVTLPTELAVNESLELLARLDAETEVRAAAVVVNQMPLAPATRSAVTLDEGAPTALGIAAARHVDAAAERARLEPLGLPLLDVPAVTDPDAVAAALDQTLATSGVAGLPV